jgi:hypothetical protein
MLRLILLDPWQELSGEWHEDAPDWLRILGQIGEKGSIERGPRTRSTTFPTTARRHDGAATASLQPGPWSQSPVVPFPVNLDSLSHYSAPGNPRVMMSSPHGMVTDSHRRGYPWTARNLIASFARWRD